MMVQPIDYKLYQDSDLNDNDSLVRALGRAVSTSHIEDYEASTIGWKVIVDAVESMDQDDLQKLHRKFRDNYREADNSLLESLSLEPPGEIDELRAECKGFIERLKRSPRVVKQRELLICLSDQLKQAHNIVTVDMQQVKKNSLCRADMYLVLKNQLSGAHNGPPCPQFMVLDGDGHRHSNIKPETPAPQVTVPVDPREIFLNLMNGPMARACGISEPAHADEQSLSVEDGVDSSSDRQVTRGYEERECYTDVLFENDIAEYIREESLRIDTEFSSPRMGGDDVLYETLGNREEFEAAQKDRYAAIEEINLLAEDLSSEKRGEISPEIDKLEKIQLELDTELAWKIQYEEVEKFNQANPRKIVGLTKQAMTPFLAKHLDDLRRSQGRENVDEDVFP